MPEVERSVSYWWPICAWGKLAKTVTENQEKVVNYYGEGSSFRTLCENDVKILGLGVSLNTTSLSPIVDYMLGEDHPQRVFTDDVQDGWVIDFDGNKILTKSYWLLPDYVRLTKPSKVMEYSEVLRKAIKRQDEGTTIQFCYKFNVYMSEALRLARMTVSQELKIPWLENYYLLCDMETNGTST
jgi:hypothetical protein